jgi:hypothetical protein
MKNRFYPDRRSGRFQRFLAIFRRLIYKNNGYLNEFEHIRTLERASEAFHR